MTPRFTGHFSIFCLVFFVVKSLLRIVRQCSREKLAILLIKSWSQGSILIYQVWAIDSYEAKVFCFFFFFFFSVGCYQARHCLLWRRLAQAVLLIYCRFSKMWPSSYHGNFTGGEAVLTFYRSPYLPSQREQLLCTCVTFHWPVYF